MLLKAASPSIESFSTLQDQDEVADLQEDGRDLQIRVDNPQKHLSTLETYITFRITTKVYFKHLFCALKLFDVIIIN